MKWTELPPWIFRKQPPAKFEILKELEAGQPQDPTEENIRGFIVCPTILDQPAAIILQPKFKLNPDKVWVETDEEPLELRIEKAVGLDVFNLSLNGVVSGFVGEPMNERNGSIYIFCLSGLHIRFYHPSTMLDGEPMDVIRLNTLLSLL